MSNALAREPQLAGAVRALDRLARDFDHALRSSRTPRTPDQRSASASTCQDRAARASVVTVRIVTVPERARSRKVLQRPTRQKREREEPQQDEDVRKHLNNSKKVVMGLTSLRLIEPTL
jgi:hypothetical protein